VQIVQALKKNDKHRHLQLAEDIVPNVEAVKNCHGSCIFSDEATFYL
jgi:hypothetical protein